ncbi:MAG TPA: hypothetical protein VFV67_01790 [Actinophytocola sp.]|uniref:hypothetical protein n=1 Tax=Actinophytocola sp. TaxID=1872138 RepID=UPI002DB76248|nr:hypothetical protein [Actinophytocola sp.]HEU5469356.1 hypothetical protein [Actinophytocola sp.]
MTRRPHSLLKSFVAASTLAGALLIGHTLTATATPASLAATDCPEDTHWSVELQICVADTGTVISTV